MKKISKEIKIGATFIISIALLYIGVNFLKGSNVFSKDNTYYMVVSNASGVAPSSVINTNGYQVGTVTNVSYDYNSPSRIVLSLRVNGSLRIPKGSRAYLVNELLGGVSVDLRLSQNTDYYIAGDTIESGIAHGLTGQIENVMLPQVNALVPKIDSLITALTTLVSNPALTHTLENVETLSHKLSYTADELNKLFHNELPRLMSSLQGTSHNLNEITTDLSHIDYTQTLARVDSTINNLQALSAALISDQSSVGKLINDTAFYHNLNNVCTNANALIEDVKAHPSRYISISVFGKKN